MQVADFLEDSETVNSLIRSCQETLSYYEVGDFTEQEAEALLSLQPHLSYGIMGAPEYLQSWIHVLFSKTAPPPPS